MAGLVEQWAEFVHTTTFEDLPEDVIGRTKLAIIDSLAVAGAGSTTPVGAAIERYAAAKTHHSGAAEEQIAVYPTGRHYDDWEIAGLVQGTFGYGHLYGDTSLKSVTHPGPVIISSAITAAQRVNASGRAVILAVALGYQVLEAFAVQLNGVPPRMALQIRGFRPTAICGPLGAVATAGKLLGLDASTLAHSLAIASNQASGLRPNDGDPCASILMQTGGAVQAGHAAIDLAKAGIHGDALALEGRGGFLEAYSGRVGKLVIPDPGNWAILGTAVKLHATAHTLAPVLDMLLRLRREHGIDAEQITSIVISVPEAHMKISGGEKPLPTSTAEATASYAFGAAAALVTGDYLWPSALERSLKDPAVARLAAKIKIRSDPEHTAQFDSGEKMWPASVEMSVGTQHLQASTDRPDGTEFSLAMVEAVTRKFDALAPHWPIENVDTAAIRDYVMDLENSTDFAAGLFASTGINLTEGK